MASTTYLTLPSGQKMPAVGLGTWESTNEQELEQALNTAIEKGYRHIDTAHAYGNEAAIGRVLKKWFESGKLKREDLFITTKLPVVGVHPDRLEKFLKESLSNLQLDYLDLYLVHYPGCAQFKDGALVFDEQGKIQMEPKTNQAALWKKLEEQVDAGRTKNIGLSNYTIPQIQEILNVARIKPANLQIEVHVYLQQHALVDFCHKNGITVVAYSPLGNPGYNKFLQKFNTEPRKLPEILSDKVIGKIAQKYKKSPAQVALKYLLQRGLSVIPKSVQPKRVQENIDLFDFKLTDDEMKQLNTLEVGEDARVVDWLVLKGIDEYPEYPFGKKSGSVCTR